MLLRAIVSDVVWDDVPQERLDLQRLNRVHFLQLVPSALHSVKVE